MDILSSSQIKFSYTRNVLQKKWRIIVRTKVVFGEVNDDKVKLFSLEGLEKATDNFNKNRVLGKGGQGKGMLIDGKIIALLGSCLETEISLLVYEFIPNGNLFEYLHGQNEDLPMTWEMRLRIATKVAGALFYLHLAASRPIYHRDIKTTNILLDEKYRAKVADFVVQGTFGYMDPEYFHNSQFTEKSVYSFGVVLVELLTGQKPISLLRPEEAKSLVIFHSLVMKEGEKEHIMAVANLAGRCLELNGKKPPTMKEVTMELEGIRKLEGKSNTLERHDDLEHVPTEDYQI
ncbi:hypothetical protein GLYMA_15G120600v4 [Glycine max]|uniref:Protein kinase domain-containing protein n=1 Tax=Glycine max TaxID=3847 RepID=A0A0R0FZL0_SOYBN|nr:hypothetical protein GLYMA_15G120600v4 [Glycine max]